MQSSVYIINQTMLFFSFNKNKSKLWTYERTYKFCYFDRSLSKKKFICKYQMMGDELKIISDYHEEEQTCMYWNVQKTFNSSQI